MTRQDAQNQGLSSHYAPRGNLLIYPGHASAHLHLNSLKNVLGEHIVEINRTRVTFTLSNGEVWMQRWILQASDVYRVRGTEVKRCVVHWSCNTAWTDEVRAAALPDLSSCCRPNTLEFLSDAQEQLVDGKHWLLR